ncbi:MAG: ACT domain-containing protein, partial [Candidatus Gastranaerophilaceae bacterium]
ADLSQVRITMANLPDSPGNAAMIFSKLADNNVSVDMIIQSQAKDDNTNDIAFTVSKADLNQALKTLKEVKTEINTAEIIVDENIAKVSIIGAGMIDRPGIASCMFNSLGENNINIKMISTSEIKISCLVDKDRAHDAVRALHSSFNLDQDKEVVKVHGLS